MAIRKEPVIAGATAARVFGADISVPGRRVSAAVVRVGTAYEARRPDASTGRDRAGDRGCAEVGP